MFIVASVLLVASNLRASITAVGPLLDTIQEGVGLSTGVAGLLTAVPLLAFAALSPVAPGLSGRLGIERVLFGALLLLAAGILLRSSTSTHPLVALFGGTLAIGLAIALGNVLLPSLIKRDFPARTGLMTGLYTATMNTAAALASGISVPLASGLGIGWSGALALWTLPVLAAALLWIPRLRVGPRRGDTRHRSLARSGLWSSALAWQVTLFMGLQSVVFYVSITWLPAILRDGGLAAAQAGWMVSIMQLVAIPAAFFAPVLAERGASQRMVIVCASTLSGVGILGLLLSAGGAGVILCVILLGLGQGACISLALTLFALRAPDPGRAAELSSMSQTFGYLLAAAGPPAFGLLHEASGSWSLPLLALLAVTVGLAASGLGAGRDALVPSRSAVGVPEEG